MFDLLPCLGSSFAKTGRQENTKQPRKYQNMNRPQQDWDHRISSILADQGLICVKNSDIGGKSRPAHRHDGLEIVFCERGQGTYHVGDQVFPLAPAALFLFQANTPHFMRVPNRFERWKLCVPENSVLTDMLCHAADIQTPWYTSTSNRSFQRIKRVLIEIRSELRRPQQDSRQLIRLMLEQLAVLIKREHPQHGQEREISTDILAEMTGFIDAHLATALSISALSERFSYTRGHMWRLFRKNFGVSPTEYIQQRRLRESKKLLVHTDHSVATIAQMVGFNDSSYFTHRFKDATGTTPEAYRRAATRPRDNQNPTRDLHTRQATVYSDTMTMNIQGLQH